MKKFLLILAAAVVLCTFSLAAADESPVLGKPFPEFHFLDTAQKIQTLSGLAASNENRLITFTGEKENYHVQVVRAPEGYSFDPEYELQTGAGYGEWILVVRKN